METKEKIRKYYEKPRINKVKLEIEEAVLAACKVSQGSTTGKQPWRYCGTLVCHNTFGS